MFKLRTLQQSMELEELEHKATKARLADKNKINQSIEEATSEALKGETGSSTENKGRVQWCLNASDLKHSLAIHRFVPYNKQTNPTNLLPMFFLFFSFFPRDGIHTAGRAQLEDAGGGEAAAAEEGALHAGL